MSSEGLENTRIPSVMEDPSTLAVAKMYAEALVGASQSAGVENVLEEFESFLVDVLDKNPEFATDYGVRMTDGKFEGLSARAIVVIDERGTVLHSQLVPEIAEEPDYDAALAALGG